MNGVRCAELASIPDRLILGSPQSCMGSLGSEIQVLHHFERKVISLLPRKIPARAYVQLLGQFSGLGLPGSPRVKNPSLQGLASDLSSY